LIYIAGWKNISSYCPFNKYLAFPLHWIFFISSPPPPPPSRHEDPSYPLAPRLRCQLAPLGVGGRGWEGRGRGEGRGDKIKGFLIANVLKILPQASYSIFNRKEGAPHSIGNAYIIFSFIF